MKTKKIIALMLSLAMVLGGCGSDDAAYGLRKERARTYPNKDSHERSAGQGGDQS